MMAMTTRSSIKVKQFCFTCPGAGEKAAVITLLFFLKRDLPDEFIIDPPFIWHG
jgi:hypothetical protein